MDLTKLSPERKRENAVKGGRSVPAHKRKFYLDPLWAQEVGRRGGLKRAANAAARAAATA